MSIVLVILKTKKYVTKMAQVEKGNILDEATANSLLVAS